MRFLFGRKGGFSGATGMLITVIILTCCILCGMPNFYNPFDKRAKVADAETPRIQLIATFSTYYGDSAPNRKHNVALAASKIDGTVLYPEEEFSFNDVVGPRRVERGFKTAYIISNGEFVEGVGGGVCQVSSTVYNAALLSDLTVTHVRAHSLPVSYVSPSFDAMVSSGSDLRFVNTLSAPITIKMRADGKFLKCEIHGVAGRKVRRRSETLAVIPNEIEYRDDDTISLGEEVIDSHGHAGLKSVGYLEYYEEGKPVYSVKIRFDSYAPGKRVILRGTKSNIDIELPEEV